MFSEVIAKTMLEAETWAVVGANENPEKYGSRVYRALKANGYRVYPVNPKRARVDGDPCYPDLSSLPVKPDVVNLVVSPERGKAIVEEAGLLGIPMIWFQPGTHEPVLVERAETLGMTTLMHCVLVALASK